MTQGKSPSELIMNLDGLEEVRILGSGSFGIVKLMKDRETKKQFAVKFIQGQIEGDLLVRAVSILGLVNHPCTLKIVGWSLPNEICCEARIATEFVPNGSLEDILKNVASGETPKVWSHDSIAIMITGIVCGMKYLHSRDIVHRDLKPGNLLIDEKNWIRICDFGSAKLENCGATTRSIATPLYVAPEILNGMKPTKKVDVYAFGLIAYEMLTGESVFPRDAPLMRIVGLQFQGFRPEIPAFVASGFGKLIKECWSNDYEKRPTFDKIYEDLRSLGFKVFNDVNSRFVEDFICEMEKEIEGM
jgi:serine/threonine protein kinase